MKRLSIILAAISLTLFVACGSKDQKTKKGDDTHIAVDETFRPIVEEELRVFALNNPTLDKIQPIYISETEAINLMLRDSVRMIVATRKLNDKEVSSILSNYKLQVRQDQIATDGIALIVNNNNNDTLITMGEIDKIVTGQITKWEQIQNSKSSGDLELVFDNPNSSTVRYIKDSICKGRELKGNLKAQKTNQDVIDYVAKTRNAIGVIGVDWLRDVSDSTRLKFLPNIRIMSVSRSTVAESGNSFQPLQYYLATGEYPLTRSVFVISSFTRQSESPRQFYFFLSDTGGQLIITKSSQLLPYMPVQIKNVSVTE